MEVSFTLQHTNLLIVLCSLVVIFYLLSKRFSKRRTIIFGNFKTLQKVSGKKLLSFSVIPVLIRMTALILIILSISDPIVVLISQASNTDYVLAIDTSSSMLTSDIKPSRLEATKMAVTEFIRENRVSSFGVVTFSGEAKIMSGLTKESENLTGTIEGIGVDDSAGTAIGEAIIVATTLFADSKGNKTLILITDGRNNRGLDINKTYNSLSEKDIQVICIGLGKYINETVEIPEELKKYNATIAEFPYVYEAELRGLSNATKGSYYPVSQMDELQSAIKKSVRMETQRLDLQFYLLVAACIVLLIGWGLEMTRYRVIP